jgi:hypothetical protein
MLLIGLLLLLIVLLLDLYIGWIPHVQIKLIIQILGKGLFASIVEVPIFEDLEKLWTKGCCQTLGELRNLPN